MLHSSCTPGKMFSRKKRRRTRPLMRGRRRRPKGEDMFKMIALMMIFSWFFLSSGAFAKEAEDGHSPHRHGHSAYAKVKNPVARTAKSIAEGGKLFEKHCGTCHGKGGKGGIGPDLTGPMRMHGNSDGEIYHVITEGVAGTAMKGFGKELPEEMRWNLVNYIQSLK
jgi:mono/diheme cytochrome c family protein